LDRPQGGRRPQLSGHVRLMSDPAGEIIHSPAARHFCAALMAYRLPEDHAPAPAMSATGARRANESRNTVKIADSPASRPRPNGRRRRRRLFLGQPQSTAFRRGRTRLSTAVCKVGRKDNQAIILAALGLRARIAQPPPAATFFAKARRGRARQCPELSRTGVAGGSGERQYG